MSLPKGTMFYYPSNNGAALFCRIESESEEDYLVQIGDMLFYIPKKSVDAHGIVVEPSKAKAIITQRIEDPENSLVYMRYAWNETLFDRMYNWYCRRKGRVMEPVVIPPARNAVAISSLTQPDLPDRDSGD